MVEKSSIIWGPLEVGSLPTYSDHWYGFRYLDWLKLLPLLPLLFRIVKPLRDTMALPPCRLECVEVAE